MLFKIAKGDTVIQILASPASIPFSLWCNYYFETVSSDSICVISF